MVTHSNPASKNNNKKEPLPKFNPKSNTGLVFHHSPNFNRGSGPEPEDRRLQGVVGSPQDRAHAHSGRISYAHSSGPLPSLSATPRGYSGSLDRHRHGPDRLTCTHSPLSRSTLNYRKACKDPERPPPMLFVIAAHRAEVTGSSFSLDCTSACLCQQGRSYTEGGT